MTESFRDFALTPTCGACREIIAWRESHPEIEIAEPRKLRIYWRSYSSVAGLLKHRSHIEIITVEGSHAQKEAAKQNVIALTNCGDFAQAFRVLFDRGTWAYSYLHSLFQRMGESRDIGQFVSGASGVYAEPLQHAGQMLRSNQS